MPTLAYQSGASFTWRVLHHSFKPPSVIVRGEFFDGKNDASGNAVEVTRPTLELALEAIHRLAAALAADLGYASAGETPQVR